MRTLAVLPVLISAAIRNATVYHDLESDSYSFTPDVVDDGFGTAFGFFEDAVSTTGWGWFTADSGQEYANKYQYHAMGMLEGVFSYDQINSYGANQFADWGFQPGAAPPKLKDFMQASLNYFKSSPNVTDPVEVKIWNQVAYLAGQFAGLVEGYLLGAQLAGKAPVYDELDLYMLNAAGDMEDLVGVFAGGKRMPMAGMLECSGLVRATSNDIFVGQTTWRSFTLMNRVYKDVSCAGPRVSFSSQPGFLSSKDDFYIANGQLAVFETTNAIFNTSLYNLLKPDTLLTWVRSAVANAVATSAEEWTDVFSRFNSGTYNNQWGVVDMKLFKPGQPLAAGLFWILEQIPGQTRRQDVTAVLEKQGYWGSYNVPYFPDIFALSGYPAEAAKAPDWYSYNDCARAKIFQRDAVKTTSLSDVQSLMTQNNYASDPLSKGDPALAIASRYDLRKTGAAPFGGVDSKITSASLISSYGGVVISGPTHQNLTPFSWTDPRWAKMSHVGQPDIWNFSWVKIPRIPMP